MRKPYFAKARKKEAVDRFYAGESVRSLCTAYGITTSRLYAVAKADPRPAPRNKSLAVVVDVRRHHDPDEYRERLSAGTWLDHELAKVIEEKDVGYWDFSELVAYRKFESGYRTYLAGDNVREIERVILPVLCEMTLPSGTFIATFGRQDGLDGRITRKIYVTAPAIEGAPV